MCIQCLSLRIVVQKYVRSVRSVRSVRRNQCETAHKTMRKSIKVRSFTVRNLSEVHGLELCKTADKTNG